MSFRNTFITDFIYQASDETKEASIELNKIFKEWCGSTLVSKIDERGYGYFAGVFKGLYPTEYQNDLTQIIPKIEKATKVKFRLIILPESEPAIIYLIEPKNENPTQNPTQ